MLRSTLALMNRSLRLDMRRRRYHLLRLIVVGWLFVFLNAVQAQSGFIASPGLWYFRPIIWLNFVAISLATCFFATAITEEKEEQTLELFTVAGIRPPAILLGKGINRLVAALSVLIVQIPFTLLAITMGGVTYAQIAAAYLALAAYLFLAAGIGLFCSVVCARSGAAMFFAAMSLLAVHFTEPLLQMLTDHLIKNGYLAQSGGAVQFAETLIELLSAASLTNRYAIILKTGFQGSLFSFQVTSHLVAGGVLFAGSWLLFDMFNRGASYSTSSRGWALRPNSRLIDLSPGRPQGNPLAWKDFHFLAGGKLMLLLRLLLIPLLAVGVELFPQVRPTSDPRIETILDYVILISLIFLVVELSVQASRVFHEEIQWNTLGNLALLPLSMRSIAAGKIRGCLCGCAPAVLWLAIGIIWRANIIWEELQFSSALIWGISYVVLFVLFLHLTAYVSLIVRWGALPLAIGIFALFLLFCYSCLGTMLLGLIGTQARLASTALACYLMFIAAVCTALLQLEIVVRLRSAQAR